MVVIDFEVMHQVLADLTKKKIIPEVTTVSVTRTDIRTEHELFEVSDEEPEGGADITIVLPKTHERVYVTRFLLMRRTKENLTELN